MLLAAVRRFVIVFAIAAGGTALVSLGFGVLIGRAARSVSVGLYVVGSVLLLGSFFVGNRGPFRPQLSDAGKGGLLAPRALRRASKEDRSQTVRSSVFLFGVGIGLIVLGALLDPDHKAV